MKRALPLFVVVFLIAAATACCYAESGQGAVYQFSTIAALKRGALDGPITFARLRNKGDFGLGTVNGLDGEMIALDGTFYQVKVDGSVHELGDSSRTPFAVITSFVPTKAHAHYREMTMRELMESLDKLLPRKHLIYAIRVEGIFKQVKARSIPRQSEPGGSLQKAVDQQRVFNLTNVAGTMVGFFFPEYMGGINVPGYHFHFLSKEKNAGGHVLDCTIASCGTKWTECSQLELTLQSNQ